MTGATTIGLAHGGGFGRSYMNYGNHSGGDSHHYFYHGNGYHSNFLYFPSDDDHDHDHNRPYCSRANPAYNPYTGAYICRDGRLHYCS